MASPSCEGQFEGSTHDPTVEPLAVSRWLQAVGEWGDKRLTNIKKEFSTAFGAKAAGRVKDHRMYPAVKTVSPNKGAGTPMPTSSASTSLRASTIIRQQSPWRSSTDCKP